MGAWSATPFGNDAASDWAADFAAEPSFEALEAALVQASGPEYLEADGGSAAVAAAATVARLFGDNSSEFDPASVDEWVASVRGTAVPAALRTAALRALDRVTSKDSELAEVWSESGDDEWLDEIESLRRRLSG